MKNQQLQNDTTLSLLVGQVIKQLDQPSVINSDLQEQLSALQSTLQERSFDAASQPIKTWEQLRERLPQIKLAYKHGQFVPLEAACDHLYEFLIQKDQETRKDQREYWKAVTMLYELNDIFQRYLSINDWAYVLGEKVYDELKEESVNWDASLDARSEKRELIREKVLFCTCRGNELKRRGDTNGARRMFKWLYDFIATKVSDEKNLPCYATLANLSYHLGSVYRILEQHGKAEAEYTNALNLYHNRSSLRKNDVADFFWVTRRIAMCIGLGYGWLNLTCGHLERARHALATARTMLARIPDNVVTFYIELLWGTIERCLAGRDEVALEKAIESLKRAHDNLKDRHARYAARACWELALAFNQLEKFAEADEHLNMMAEFEERKMNFKWQANIHVLRSRIRRGQKKYEEALNEAEAALRLANECEEILPRIDALITKGEVYLEVAEKTNEKDAHFSQARADFEEGLHLLEDQQRGPADAGYSLNPKIAAVCELRIAQCWLRERNETEARKRFNKWLLLQQSVEHGWVRELARDVKTELDKKSDDFRISAKDPSKWNYSECVADLRNWLLSQAMRQNQNNWSAAAKLIGVERATLYQWKSVKDPVKRARISDKTKTEKVTETPPA